MDEPSISTNNNKPKKRKRNDFQQFMDFFDKLVETVLISMMCGVLICVWLQVLGRYLHFVKPLPWTEEIARWILVWLTFLGASHVAKTSSFTRVDFFVKKASPKVQEIIGIFNKLCMIGFTGWFTYKSFTVFTTVSVHELGPTTQLPMLIMRSAVFVGIGITCLQMLANGGIYLEAPEEEEQSV